MGPKKAKSKTSDTVDGVDTSKMSREQLELYSHKILEEMEREREERNFFQLERDKLRTFWEITRNQLDEAKATIRNKEREKEELAEKHDEEIKLYKQKVKHLMYEHHTNLSETKAEHMVALKLAQDDHNDQENELIKDKKELRKIQKENELAHINEIRLLKLMLSVISQNYTLKSTLFYISLLLIINISNVASQCGGTSTDRQDKLAIYKVILRTYWSRARFPRHYPEWRPPAQFGKLVGRTHDSTYTLYRLGERLSPGAMQYVETGRTDSLDTGGDSPNILDVFGGPGIPQGEGNTVTRAFLDGNHTLVSMMARINPSPDWFVGVDSFQLCVEGNWVDTVTVELDPLDGGTDNGFTFTAANWPTNPQGIAYRITSRYPAHPAGSFYYPNLPRLPPIATLTFTKLKEYTLTETYHEDEVEMEFISNDKSPYNLAVGTPRGIDPNRDLNEAIAEERKEMDTQRYRYWTSGPTNPLVTDHPVDNKAAIMDSIASSYSLGMSRARFPATPTSLPGQRYHVIPSLNFNLANSQDSRTRQEIMQRKSADALMERQKEQIYQDIQRRIANATNNNNNNNRNNVNISSNNVDFNTTRSYSDDNIITSTKETHKFRKQHRFAKGKHFRRRIPRDCKVGDWEAWSACSRSCGVGETQRVRKITVKPRRGGAPCPPLKETKWCGSATPCPDNNNNNNKPIVDIFSW